MSASRHTPGPWEFVPAGNTPVVQQAGSFPHGFICNVESLNFVADARLIAAAPEMLEALVLAKGWLELWSSAERELAIINAAIAKAEGRASAARAALSGSKD